MSSKTKIVVLRMKEVIYTAIFVGLAILLLILCFIMFRPEKKAVPSASTYIPGKYSASLTLGNEHVNVEVTVDPGCKPGPFKRSSFNHVPFNAAFYE